MCPLYPFHLILLYLCLLLPLLFAVVEGAEELTSKLSIYGERKFREKEVSEMNVACLNCPAGSSLTLSSDDDAVASIDGVDKNFHQKRRASREDCKEVIVDLAGKSGNWSLYFNVSGNFLGFATVKADLRNASHHVALTGEARMSVLRAPTAASKVFSASVASLVTLAYVNMGCALDLAVIKEELRRPVGPTIGFAAQFLIMPVVSFAAGYIFNSGPMRLGLFATGASPGGGASNMWTLMFGGNLHLSLAMTAVSTFSALFMMPLWLMTLGKVIFDDHAISIPYKNIVMYASCLVIPLCVGLLIRRFLPKVSNFLVKILKPMAFAILLFIICFGIYANQYIFRVMDYKVWIAGMILPWSGFLLGYAFALIGKQSVENVTAIAIETGVQNTGVSIFILWLSLDKPLGDLAAVVPIAVAIMTPVPLFTCLAILKVRTLFMTKSPSTEYISGNTDGDDSFSFSRGKANGGGGGHINANVKLSSISKKISLEEKA